jgi:hypothetical protein
MTLTARDGTAIAKGYARGEPVSFRHARSDEEFRLRRGMLTIMRCRACAWEEHDQLFVESVTDDGKALSIATRLPDEECTPGPVIRLPYQREARA